MKKQKGYTIIELLMVLWFIFLLCCIPAWIGCIYKLIGSDDFKAPYKAEVMHGVGVVMPITAPFVVWVNDSK